ncbi:MAG: isochorismatase family cysteine hydrolase [Pelolinea sp.]|nr:isochorismatase family cysteine hydrolase [Pelolinea sp.]
MKKPTEKFINFLEQFMEQLESCIWSDLAIQSDKTAVISVDMTNAFCRTGNLASDRVAALIPPIVKIFNLAWERGVRDMILLQDCHTAAAEEFGAFAEHGICGTEEAEAVDEIKSLPFYNEMKIIQKNSIHPAYATIFDSWLTKNFHLNTFIIVGDCTDLCIYQTAMHLRISANALDIQRRVIVPEECVNTYDLPLQTAIEIKAQPHPGDLLHKLFLHHMVLNGIEVYKQII